MLTTEQLKSDNEKLQAELANYRQLVQNLRGEGVKQTTGEPDGRVVSVNPTSGEVYINLSKNDRIVPGITFTAPQAPHFFNSKPYIIKAVFMPTFAGYFGCMIMTCAQYVPPDIT